jgi:hypothetical protein
MINPNCEYCGRHNPDGIERCQACGAPLPYAAAPEARVTIVDAQEPPSPNVEETLSELLPSGYQLPESLRHVGAVAGTLGVGAIILRVAAQGIAIAVSAFLTGLAAGESASGLNRYLLHLLTALIGGALLGIVISLVRKRTIWTLFAIPWGAFFGYILPVIFPFNTGRFPLAALLTVVGGVLFAVIGGKRTRGKPLPCLKVLQPILGAIGGLLFALLGFYVMYRAY